MRRRAWHHMMDPHKGQARYQAHPLRSTESDRLSEGGYGGMASEWIAGTWQPCTTLNSRSDIMASRPAGCVLIFDMTSLVPVKQA